MIRNGILALTLIYFMCHMSCNVMCECDIGKASMNATIDEHYGYLTANKILFEKLQ